MKTVTIFSKNTFFWVYLILVLLVSLIHWKIFQPVIQYQNYFPSEWPFIIYYRALQPHAFGHFWDVWTKYLGLHGTDHMYFIGILSDFLGSNYLMYTVVNIVLKIIATLSVFPLVFIIFRNKLLAFLTTIIFAISSATTGPLDLATNGKDYIALALMNISLIVYYRSINSVAKRASMLSALLFFITYMVSPGRMFTLFLLIPLSEMFWLLTTHKLSNLKISLFRVFVIFLPIILISIHSPASFCCPHEKGPQLLLADTLSGNLYNLLDPLAPLSWTIFPNYYWKFFGILDNQSLDNLGNYLFFLIKSPLLIFGVLNLILAFILSKKPLKFFVKVMILNLIADIVIYFLASKHSIPGGSSATEPRLYLMYPVLASAFILIIALVSFLERKSSKISAAIWIGPAISMIFLLPMWIVVGHLINDWFSGQRYYLLPAMGGALFTGAVLTAIYEKSKSNQLSKSLSMVIMFIILFNLYKTNKDEVYLHFVPEDRKDIKISEVSLLYDRLINALGDSAKQGDVLIYFDENKSDITPEYLKIVFTFNNFGDIIHQRRALGTTGCIGSFSGKEKLIKSLQIRNNEEGFGINARCFDNDIIPNVTMWLDKPWFFKVKDFHAFYIQRGNLIDITKETLKEIGLLSN